MMGIEIGLAQARKMLGRAHHICRAQSGQKLPRINHGLFRIGRNRTRTHHRLRSFERQIHDRSEVGIKSKSPARFADDLAVPAEELAVAGGENIGGRRS